VLSLLDNPVVLRPHYRLYTIHKLPALTLLDFAKVTQKEREAATQVLVVVVVEFVQLTAFVFLFPNL
jgi:hypothetical protein